MSNHIRQASGDAYAAWEDVKCTRQEYATERIQSFQRLIVGHRPVPFVVLLDLFRKYGEEWDRWTAERGRGAA